MTTALPPAQIVINDRPSHLKQHIDVLQTHHQANATALERYASEHKQLTRTKQILASTGLGLFILGLALGILWNPMLLALMLVGVGIFVYIALVFGKRLQALEKTTPPDVTGRCTAASGLLASLHEDLATSRRIEGQIDLRPIEQSCSANRERPGLGGATVSYFQHPWLSLEAHMVDGNKLRLTAIERLKLRTGHYRKGSISGKSKWKPEKRSMHQQIAIRLQINPAIYDSTISKPLPKSSRVGGFTVLRATIQRDELRIVAEAAGDRLAPEELLQLLHQIYLGLARRAKHP
ncbi:MAG: DUF2207 domain-containing protein [Oscillochloris sp.]|nr:DUF2207 domain-containing protein [Oscillochloris sp.]